MPNCEHIIKAKITSKLRNYQKKYSTEPAKIRLSSVMEIVRNYSIMNNIGHIQNFGRNNGDLNNSKQKPPKFFANFFPHSD